MVQKERLIIVSEANLDELGQLFSKKYDLEVITPSDLIANSIEISRFVFVHSRSCSKLQPISRDRKSRLSSTSVVIEFAVFNSSDELTNLPWAQEHLILDHRISPSILDSLLTSYHRRIELESELESKSFSLDFAEDMSKLGSWKWYPSQNSFLSSPSFLKIFEKNIEVKSDLFLIDHFLSLVDPMDQQKLQNIMDQEEDRSDIKQVECRIHTPSGKVKYLVVNGKLFKGDEGEEDFYSGVVQDITTLKNASEILDKQERFLELTADRAAVGGWELDVSDGKLFWTQATFDIHEAPHSFVPTMAASVDFFYPDDRPKILEKYSKAVNSGKPFSFQSRIKTGKDNEVWVEVIGTSVKAANEVKKLTGIIQDISKDKKLDEERRIRATILDNMADAVIAIDVSGKIIFWNQAASILYGYSEKEVIQKNLEEYYPPNTSDATGKSVIENLKSGVSQSGEYTIQDRDGRTFSIYANNSPVFNDSGELVALVAISRDISEQQDYIAKLKQSQHRLKLIFEHSPIGISITNMSTGRCLDCNKAMLQILGYKKHELLKLTHQDITTKKSQEIDKQQFKTVTVPGEFGPYEKTYIAKDGSYVNVIIAGFTMLNALGEAEAWTNVVDLRELEEKVEALRRSDERFKNYVEKATDITSTIDANGYFTYISPNVESHLGYSVEEILGKSVIDYVHPDDKEVLLTEYQKFSHREDHPVRLSYRILHKQGHYIWLQADGRIRKSETDGSYYLLFVARDIDNERRAELTAYEQNNKLKEIAYIQSHILRRPLANILGLLDATSQSSNREKRDEYFRLIKQEAEAMDAVVSEIVQKSTQITDSN